MTSASPAPLMLSVSGCRGIFGQSMTPETAARFALVAGRFFAERAGTTGPRKPLIVLGRDGRLGGELLARAAASGLAAAGCDVLDCGVAMTPTLGVMADARQAAGAIVVTASHNPQQWNGLKVIARDPSSKQPRTAAAPPKAVADEIIARFRASEQTGARGVEVTDIGAITQAAPGGEKALGFPSEAVHTHLDVVREALKSIGCVQDRRWQSVRCIVDSVNASGAPAARALLGDTIVHHLGSSDSGIFPHAPEPTRENLTTLARFVAEKKADVGFAQDPDADRLAIIDERGSYIGEEYTLVLAAEALLGADPARAKGATICVNLSTSRMIEDVAARHGARVQRTAVGEANVVDAMKAHGSPIGGEGNGGVIWPAVTYIRDSLSAMGLVLALMTRTQKPISQLVAEIPRYAIIKRKVDLASTDQARAAIEAVARLHTSTPTPPTTTTTRIDRADGVWVGLDAQRAWLHVRASNTEPIMRLIAEAPTEAAANQILDHAAAAIAAG